MKSIALTHDEAVSLMSAVQLCTPSGGGSKMNSLLVKLQAAFPDVSFDELCPDRMWAIAVREWEEATGLTLPTEEG